MKIARIFLYMTFFFSLNTYAYIEETHQDLSSEALKISNVAIEPSLLQNLGLEKYGANQTFPSPINTNDIKTIREIIRDGAKFEDAFPRSLSHFYNPINNTAGMGGNTSPDWAIEDNGNITSGLSGEQSYSYKDAMEFFNQALTAQTKQERDENWGSVFQALGQIIHHVQDMAQPDHARNDAHCDHLLCGVSMVLYDKSWYEHYTDGLRRDSDTVFSALLTGNTYPIPSFPTAREYWTTQASDLTIINRRGLADFTNRNFVSKDTIFKLNDGLIVPHDDFPYPVPNVTPVSVNISDPSIMGANGQALCDSIKAQSIIPFPASACFMDFVSTPLTDANTGISTTNNRAATYSIFDKKLRDHNIDALYTREDGSIDTIDRSFTLNEFNFKAAHNYLIPRAVAYSAGLINHFFRGKIDMVQNPTGDGWLIQNLSSEEMEGTFRLYCDDVFGNRTQITDYNITTTGVLHSNESINAPVFTCSGNATLVFQGRIGDEGDPNLQNDNYITTGFNLFPLPRRYATVVLVRIPSNVDSTITHQYVNSYFVHNNNIYEFDVMQTYDVYSGDVNADNYFHLIRLDGSVIVVEYTNEFTCTVDINGGSRTNNLWYGGYVFPVFNDGLCGQPNTLPSMDDLSDLPFGYRVRDWSLGKLSRFHVGHNSGGYTRRGFGLMIWRNESITAGANGTTVTTEIEGGGSWTLNDRLYITANYDLPYVLNDVNECARLDLDDMYSQFNITSSYSTDISMANSYDSVYAFTKSYIRSFVLKDYCK